MNFENELSTTRAGSEKLGIKPGLTQEEFNKAIISVLEARLFGPQQATGSTISTAADLTTTAGKNFVKSLNFEPSAADVKTEMKDSSVEVAYDLSQTIKSLPKDAVIKKTSVLLNGKRSIVLNSSTKSQVVNVPPSEFPLTIDVTISAASADGEFVVSGSKVLPAVDSVSNLGFVNTVTVGKDIETQEDFNKKILEELNFLKRAMP